MAAAGFGGLEIGFLADRLTNVPQSSMLPVSQRLGQPGIDQSTAQTSGGQCCLAFSNAQARTIGFGSENWQKVLTQIFETADTDHLHVDLTLSQHWPLAFDDIDPNDPGQQQEAVTAYRPITSAEVAAGTLEVPLPPQRLQDQDGVPFVFVDHYQSATIAKVASMTRSGAPIFAYASLTDVSPETKRISEQDGKRAGHAAGIMDAAWIRKNPEIFKGNLAAGSDTISNTYPSCRTYGTRFAPATPANLPAWFAPATPANLPACQAGSTLSGPGIVPGTSVISVSANSIKMSRPASDSSSGVRINARWSLNTINADWGPVPPANAKFTVDNGKIDAAGERRRMADWQYEYQTAVRAAALKDLGCQLAPPGGVLAPGDCVLIGTWSQGTGQTRSGGVNTVEYDREYVTSVYSTAGVRAIEGFWERNILGTWSEGQVARAPGDARLLDLIRANARTNPEDAIFEDSLELLKAGPGNLWTLGLLGQMSQALGYDAKRYAPVLAGGLRFDRSIAPGELPAARVAEDWSKTLGEDYIRKHADELQRWAKATLGYNFKQQVESGGGAPGFPGVNPYAGIQEGDNSANDDSWRALSGAANLNGSNIVSAEALTFSTDYTTPWISDIRQLNYYYSMGVNRANLHGNPFPETFDRLPVETTVNGAGSQWPGWEYQHSGPPGLTGRAYSASRTGFGAFDARQPYWSDVRELTGYIARTQAVLQMGRAKPDIAVLEGTSQSYEFPQTNALQVLLNKGWQYDVVDETELRLPGVSVTDRSLDANGPAYRAIVLDMVTDLMPSTVRMLARYAEAGLPVILYKCNIRRVYGTNQPGGHSTSLDGENDTALANAVGKLLQTRNVYRADSQVEIERALAQAGVAPYAHYSAAGLYSQHRVSQGVNYYYLYAGNNWLTHDAKAGSRAIGLESTRNLAPGDRLLIGNGPDEETVAIARVSAAVPGSEPNVLLAQPLRHFHAGGPQYAFLSTGVTAAGAADPTYVSTVIDKRITLKGTGQPYILDAWTGKAVRIADYSEDRGEVAIHLTLQPGDAVIIAVAPGAIPGLPGRTAVQYPHATSVSGDAKVIYWHADRGTVAVRAEKPGSYVVRLSDGRTRIARIRTVPRSVKLSRGWTLTLSSWGPDRRADATDPQISRVTRVHFGPDALGPWSALPATATQLSSLGVSSMSDVSGTGMYTDRFRLPKTWKSGRDGAYLQFAHGVGMVVAVAINGHKIGNIDPMTDRVDAGPSLRPGANTIQIKLDSLLGNRVGRPRQTYGLMGVKLIPYVNARCKPSVAAIPAKP